MAWTKIPAAAASIACAACIAAATALPGAEMQAAHLAKTVSGDVQFTALEDVLTDVLTATLQLDSLNGIAPLLNFAFPGDVDPDPLRAFVPTDDWPGYAALSALWLYQNTFTGSTTNPGIEAIAAFDGVPLWLTGNWDYVSAFNAIPAYTEYLQTFNLEAFRQTDTHLGLDALSALPLYEDLFSEDEAVRDGALSNLASVSAIPAYKTLLSTSATEQQRDDALRSLDSVSAVPEYKTLFSSDATVAERADALRSLDAFSAIPVYLNLPTVPAPVEDTADLTALAKTDLQATSEKTEVTSSSEIGSTEQPTSPKPVTALSSATPPAAESVGAGAPAAAPAAPETPSTPAATDTGSTSTKQSNGSYSGVFKPNNPVVLFGTGKGGGADNGIRGWDKVANGIRGALGLPKDNSGSSDSGSSGGE
jgi:hypothetical protein